MRWSSERILPTVAVAAGVSLISLALRREAVATPRRVATVPPTIGLTHGQRKTFSVAAGVSFAIVVAAAVVAALLLPGNIHFFHPEWVLHPDETGYLATSEHLAETGSFFIDDPWYAEAPSHVPAGATMVDGEIVPQKAVGGYLVYAASMLVAEDAWRWVGPVGGVLLALAAALLVQRKTASWLAAGSAGVITITASPVIMWASGLAFSDVVAVAAFLWGCWFFSIFMDRPARLSAVAAAACFGFAMMLRYDFAVAAAIATAVAAAAAYRRGTLRSVVVHALPGAIVFLAFPIALAFANNSFYGSPLTTGYAGGWQESPGGVAGSFFAVEPARMYEMVRDYLWRIGLPCTALLAIGIAAKAWLRRFDAVDGLLLGFAGFCVVYFLGRPGAYGTGESWLMSSYPRYVLPVYIAGIIVGIEAISATLERRVLQASLKASVVIAVSLIAAAIGVREAYTNPRGVDYVERLTTRHRAIEDVVSGTVKPVVLVSDLNSKAVPGTYTITPHMAPPESRDVVGDVRRQLRNGKHVLVVGDQRDHSLYTGYVEALVRSGIVLVPRRCSVEVYEAYLPASAPNEVQSC